MTEIREKGFELFTENGVELDYVRFTHNEDGSTTLEPVYPFEYVTESFAVKGQRVAFLDFNGWDGETKNVRDLGINKGDILTVKRLRVSNSKSYYTFEEIKGEHNTVMFERCKDE